VLELADIVRAAGDDYREKFAPRMLPSHLRALDDIEQCRTGALGGHVHRCDRCGLERHGYHSCRNRHCPKCEGDLTESWLATLRQKLLPCDNFFVTFTLPAEARSLARAHQRLLYGLLLRCAAEATAKLVADERHLGAQPGILAVLHTWTQTLTYHPHAHLLVTAGGLTDDGAAWRYPRRRGWLAPQYALAEVFRGKLRSALDRHGLLGELPPELWRDDKRWVVDVEPVGDGQRVVEYLARYVRRVAISNSRLLRFDDGNVTFRYRDRKKNRTRRCTLSQEEFLRRFLLHILPRGFQKVRYYGLYSTVAAPRLEQAREVLVAAREAASISSPAVPPVEAAKTGTTPDAPCSQVERPELAADPDPLCPSCKLGHLRLVVTLPRRRGPP
jgi:Putative transposase/Transposase zinc-binding domain